MDSVPFSIYICLDEVVKCKYNLDSDKLEENLEYAENPSWKTSLLNEHNPKNDECQTIKSLKSKKPCYHVNILEIKPFVEDLQSSEKCRTSALEVFTNNSKSNTSLLGKNKKNKSIVIKVYTDDSYIIDYAWGWRLWRECHMGLERECAAAWLSTLGGAFSALGDNSIKCASMALRISMHQIRLSKASMDPQGIARGWLFLALALSQLGHGRMSRRLLHKAAAAPSFDPRHKKMCLGVQAKLKYDSKMRKIARKQGRHITVPLEEALRSLKL